MISVYSTFSFVIMSTQLHIPLKSQLLEALPFRRSENIFTLTGVVWLLSLKLSLVLRNLIQTSGLPFGVLIYQLLAQARVPEHRDEDIVPSLDFSSYTDSRIGTLSTAHAAKTEMRMMQNLMMRLTLLLPRRNFSMSTALLRLLLVLPRPWLLIVVIVVVMNLWMAFKDSWITLILVIVTLHTP